MSDTILGQTETIGPALSPEPPRERSASLWADARRDLIRNPTFVIASIYLLFVGSMAAFPKLWTRVHYRDCALTADNGLPNAKLPMFSPGHWLGTSEAGCDFWSLSVYGARPSMLIAVMSTFGIVIIGLPLGVLAGYFGGWLDAIISRLVDMVFALPFLLVGLVVLSIIKVTDPNLRIWTVTMFLVLLGWTTVARIMRGSVIAVKNLDFVMAAKSLGATHGRLMFRHILPNAIAPVFVIASVALGGFVATEATLTFLGVGLQAPATSWGIMISTHQPLIQDYPHLVLIPCTLLIGTVLSFVLIGDALRDALDPKLR